MDKRPSPKDLEKFMLEISKLDAMEFLGLAKIFNVDLVDVEDKEKKTREFETVFSEIMDKYITLSRKRRRTIMKLIKSANLGKIEV